MLVYFICLHPHDKDRYEISGRGEYIRPPLLTADHSSSRSISLAQSGTSRPKVT